MIYSLNNIIGHFIFFVTRNWSAFFLNLKYTLPVIFSSRIPSFYDKRNEAFKEFTRKK